LSGNNGSTLKETKDTIVTPAAKVASRAVESALPTMERVLEGIGLGIEKVKNVRAKKKSFWQKPSFFLKAAAAFGFIVAYISSFRKKN
jgi:hypothetical protein